VEVCAGHNRTSSDHLVGVREHPGGASILRALQVAEGPTPEHMRLRLASNSYQVRFKNFHAVTVNLTAGIDMLPINNPMIPERTVSTVHFATTSTDGSA